MRVFCGSGTKACAQYQVLKAEVHIELKRLLTWGRPRSGAGVRVFAFCTCLGVVACERNRGNRREMIFESDDDPSAFMSVFDAKWVRPL